MIVSWLLYAAWVAALLSLAALAGERALRLAGRPARLLWLGAMSLGLLIPAATFAIRTWLPETTLGLPSVGLSELVLPALFTSGEAAGSAWTTERVTELALWAAWAVASVALLGVLAHSHWRLSRERRGWLGTRVDGIPVLVSRDTGPATVGSLRPRVVLPEWALGLPGHQREMILRHELEHVRARDGLVALMGFALAAVAPWNPAMWWMLTRLRLAQEMDCDRRLLARGTSVRGYVDLLMSTGRPPYHVRLAAPGLSFPPSTLRKRILQMTYTPQPSSLIKAGAIGAVAVGLGLLACDTPAPGDADSLTGPTTNAIPPANAVAVDIAKEMPFGVAIDLHEFDGTASWTAADGETFDLSFDEISISDAKKELFLRQADEWVEEGDVAAFGNVDGDYVKLHKVEILPDGDAPVAEKAANELVGRMSLTGRPDIAPLIVLDGVIWDGSPEELKLRIDGQVSSIEVLDGDSAAQYGERGANGVIRIDTDGS